MKKSVLLFGTLLLMTFYANAQISQIESILLASKEDANKLASAYFNPISKGFIYGTNAGWYHTAKVHKTFGFDVSFGLNASMVPSEDEMYTISALGLASITSNSETAPTALGGNNAPSVEVSTTVEGQTVSASFNLPSGFKDDFVFGGLPTANMQFNLGLPYDFEAMLRFVPKVGNDNTTGELLGFGLKKEITEWFGPLDKLPLHVTLMGSFTNMKVNYGLSGNLGTATDKQINMKLNAYTVQAIASLNFPIINVYGGIGYSAGSSNYDMLGTYELEYQTGNPIVPTITQSITDPLSLTTQASSFTTTIGARLSLGFLKIYGNYSIQEYNTASLGMAISVF